MSSTLRHLEAQPENTFTQLVNAQKIALIPSLTLENGTTLNDIPVGYKTWGTLNDNGDNVMVICHALTGSADVADWWGPLLGPGLAFDTDAFFIICMNVLGSPYGTASPVTNNPKTGLKWGPNFPKVSIRDTVRLHKELLTLLGIKQVAICIGGSLGGMQVMEWAMFGEDYVRHIVPIATCGKHSAWGISWGEAQRQSIYSDPNFCNGYYTQDNTPKHGLAAARMSALLTYRSKGSFETRFGRKTMPVSASRSGTSTFVSKKEGQSEAGNKNTRVLGSSPQIFSAQNYLRYQGDKFVRRFDANCYISITQMMDTHDVSRGRGDYTEVLSGITQPALVIGIESDGLFTIDEQYVLAEYLPNSQMIVVDSPDGHDGFLLEFEQLNEHILKFTSEYLPEFLNDANRNGPRNIELKQCGNSLFGEAEDIMTW
ncbi:homoserine O-trans-acetylase [Basidiobolus meristosporus CBS 931.73]|uniref:Homoserine O-trans-acetylase n=1 Tax=Basidiobolus meristosporus CBS 931.73 TaxID=1314790 RepID=A0A1Y1XS68_9FUNG|nr:homoserine O-trans-acetylase [Basidiobolus meristosporus CBS 931.73]|eukprot:ORX88578.1 homoserine O-trans-acetylase [Basidiobolus meristosporus CBS 931.73]